jgi:EF hand
MKQSPRRFIVRDRSTKRVFTVKNSVSATILVLGASIAFAHEGMHGPGAEFDTDRNGVLSVAEFTSYLKASSQSVANVASRFAETDLNKDGSLSSVELRRAVSKAPPAAKPN